MSSFLECFLFSKADWPLIHALLLSVAMMMVSSFLMYMTKKRLQEHVYLYMHIFGTCMR